MDPLSDLLRVVRLDGAYFYSVEASDPWAIEARPARELAPRVMPYAEHLISYHIVIDGRCCGGLLDEEPIDLVSGDVIVFPHGDAHGMSSDPEVRNDRSIVNTTPDPFPVTRHVGEGGEVAGGGIPASSPAPRPIDRLKAPLAVSGPWSQRPD